jgi:hypothetical protein
MPGRLKNQGDAFVVELFGCMGLLLISGIHTDESRRALPILELDDAFDARGVHRRP